MRVVSIGLDICIEDDVDSDEICRKISSMVEKELKYEVYGYTAHADVTEEYKKMGVII